MDFIYECVVIAVKGGIGGIIISIAFGFVGLVFAAVGFFLAGFWGLFFK